MGVSGGLDLWGECDMSKPVSTGSDEHFRQAKEELDRARERYAKAESDLTHAQRCYNDASRAYATWYMEHLMARVGAGDLTAERVHAELAKLPVYFKGE